MDAYNVRDEVFTYNAYQRIVTDTELTVGVLLVLMTVCVLTDRVKHQTRPYCSCSLICTDKMCLECVKSIRLQSRKQKKIVRKPSR